MDASGCCGKLHASRVSRYVCSVGITRPLTFAACPNGVAILRPRSEGFVRKRGSGDCWRAIFFAAAGVLGILLTLNAIFYVVAGIPTTVLDYSPAWDAQLFEWTTDAINKGYRGQVREEFRASHSSKMV